MNMVILNEKSIIFILVTILMVTSGTQSISYAQAANPTMVASVEEPLTEASLHGSIITLTLNGRQFNSRYYIERALSVSGIEGVIIEDVDRVSNTVATVELEFAGNIDTNTDLTFTVEAGAIVDYNGVFTLQLPVTAVKEALEVSTEAPLTEATLHRNIITLTLSGRRFAGGWDIQDAVSVSGIDAITWRVRRTSDTEVTVALNFSGNIDEDATLMLTVGADAIAGYNETFTFQFLVPAVEESLVASTLIPLTETTLNGTEVTLTLSGRKFSSSTFDIRDAVSVSGITGVTYPWHDPNIKSDTEVTIELEFTGNIDSDATLTFTVEADAIAGYNGNPLTATLSVPAVKESMTASTEAPLTEDTLDGSTVTFTLSGRRFARWSAIEDAVSVSGIEGAAIGWREQDVVVRDLRSGGVSRTVVGISDTELTLELGFIGNIDADATLTVTVGGGAIGYDKDFTFQFPVTAIEESLEASTELPVTEATLDDSVIILSLSGRRFAGLSDFAYLRDIEDAVSVSGIEGVALWGTVWETPSDAVERLSDTEIAVKLEFDGTDFDTDGTLTFTVDGGIENYNQELTAQITVPATPNSNAIVSISPSPVVSPNIGESLTLDLNIAGGENVAGYQATVSFDRTALSLVDATNGDYLPANPFFLAYLDYREVSFTASTLAEVANGDGTLATLTFKVEDFEPSSVTISDVYLVDADGKRWEAATENGEVTIPPEPVDAILEDINRDGVVNIQDLVIVSTRFGQRGENSADINGDHLVDIADLVLVASAVNAAAAAPSLNPKALKMISAGDVQGWLSQARQLTLTDPAYRRGITVLEQLLKTLTPTKTALLSNYPNPFNPETWIPYHLSNDADVHIKIYNAKGVLVRRLDLGHQIAGYYTDQTKAAYWDGKNAFGEQIASGVYFYHLSAGDYAATRKMLILK